MQVIIIKMLIFCEFIDFMSNLWDILENKQVNYVCKDGLLWVLFFLSFEYGL